MMIVKEYLVRAQDRRSSVSMTIMHEGSLFSNFDDKLKYHSVTPR